MNIDMALEIGLYVTFGVLISVLVLVVIFAISWHWLPKKVKDELTWPKPEDVEGISVGIFFPMGGW